MINKENKKERAEVIRVQATKTYYKVIVLRIDAFESEIIDERHFPDIAEAMRFCDNINNSTEYTTFAVKM